MPAPDRNDPRLLDSLVDLRRAADRRGQAESLAARSLALADMNLASAHLKHQRLTLELSGSINREAIDLSA